MAYALGGPVAANINVKILTLLFNKRTIGRWILGDILSAGSHGRVFFTLDQSANITVIKVVEWTS